MVGGTKTPGRSDLSGTGPSVFILPQLLAVMTQGPLVFPNILTVCSHVSVVLPKTDTSFKRWITPETPPQTRR